MKDNLKEKLFAILLRVLRVLFKSRFGEAIASKLCFDAQILHKGEILFSQRIGKKEFIRILDHILGEKNEI